MRSVLATMVAVCLLAGLVPAQTGGTGIGVIIGEPTGLSLKFWRKPGVAIAAAAAWSFGNNESNTHLHADYLVHLHNLSAMNETDLFLHYGLGLRFKVASTPRVGIRIPVGFDFPFRRAPIDIFVELAPILELLPSTGFGVNAAVGSRFYF